MTIIVTETFAKSLKKLVKKYSSLIDDYAVFLNLLEENPTMGTSLGNNCYKIRIAISSKNKGKSGGARIITHLHFVQDTIYLLTIYDKSQKESITSQELKSLLEDIEED